MATITVLIPTYRRVESLHQCLLALQEQQRPAQEVIVAVRDSDAETRAYLDGNGPVARIRGAETAEKLLPPATLPLRAATVSEPGVIAAMNAGLAMTRGEILALTDDDAAPHWDWLERLHTQITRDPKIGGAGGRDYVYFGSRLDGSGYETEDVGRLTPFGMVIGNHHVGKGGPREVMLLKGVNCAYRTAAIKPIGFDRRLRGEGAQVHWELALGLSLIRAGWILIYDSAIAVDHYPSVRHGEDQRGKFQKDTHYDIIFNETLALSEHLVGTQRLAFRLWSTLVGTRFAPGLLHLIRLKLFTSGEWCAQASERYKATQTARSAARSVAVPAAAKTSKAVAVRG